MTRPLLDHADAGELQDNTERPNIDFKRDTVADIEKKLVHRGRDAIENLRKAP